MHVAASIVVSERASCWTQTSIGKTRTAESLLRCAEAASVEAANASASKVTTAQTAEVATASADVSSRKAASAKMSTASAAGPSPCWLTQSNKNSDC